jgi:predicted metalloendopeptidase
MYGADGPQADQEALVLIDMVKRLNLARPDKNGVLESYAGWKEYVNSSAFDRDVVTWGDFKNVVCASSTFAWEAFIDELGRSLLLPDFHISNAQHVWAFSRSYFEWWQPELFSLQEWKTYITFSVLYHTHDFFPELPADVLLSSRGALRPINVVSPLRGGPHRRLKKMRLSSEAYGERRRRTSSAQQKRRRSSSAADGSVITVDDCVAATKYMLPGILSREFLKRQFPTDSGETIRGRITGMVERFRDRFVKNILATPWLDPETKRLQAEKIRAIIPRVVHPTQWTEEAFPLGREMDPARYLRNLNIIQEERVKRNLALWSESNYGAACDERCRDRITPFGSPLFTVNAWYNPDRNVMTVPGGILKPPFFHEQFTDASAYGTIGWVIAHELSHGEDANGILYDKDGALINTWTNETTLRKYISRFARVVKEYGSPAVRSPKRLDFFFPHSSSISKGCNHENYGMQTLSEDIADINGLRLAYEALFVDHPPPGSGVSDKKEFFMAAAQMWCASYTQEAMCDRSRDDVHAIAPYRVDKTFSHMPYFAEVYQCPAGSPMHRHVHERIVLFGEEAVDLSPQKRKK